MKCRRTSVSGFWIDGAGVPFCCWSPCLWGPFWWSWLPKLFKRPCSYCRSHCLWHLCCCWHSSIACSCSRRSVAGVRYRLASLPLLTSLQLWASLLLQPSLLLFKSLFVIMLSLYCCSWPSGLPKFFLLLASFLASLLLPTSFTQKNFGTQRSIFVCCTEDIYKFVSRSCLLKSSSCGTRPDSTVIWKYLFVKALIASFWGGGGSDFQI